MRITRKDLNEMWRRFLNNIGHSTSNIYVLDYNSTYGGWKVERNEVSGGVSDVFGEHRRSTSEMYYTLDFANRVIERGSY